MKTLYCVFIISFNIPFMMSTAATIRRVTSEST